MDMNGWMDGCMYVCMYVCMHDVICIRKNETETSKLFFDCSIFLFLYRSIVDITLLLKKHCTALIITNYEYYYSVFAIVVVVVCLKRYNKITKKKNINIIPLHIFTLQ